MLREFANCFVSIQYWLVHKCRVDVPSMYKPHGRYRYTAGFNWRAVLAVVVSVGPTLPGLIHSINPNIFVGNDSHLFDIAWIYGVRLLLSSPPLPL